jgi:hypothetical protein
MLRPDLEEEEEEAEEGSSFDDDDDPTYCGMHFVFAGLLGKDFQGGILEFLNVE